MIRRDTHGPSCPAVLGIVVFATVLNAQTSAGVIRGTVTDSTGAVVPAAAVTAVNAETGVQYAVATNDVGLFSIPDVPPGSYSVTVERAGFRRVVRQGITMTTGETLALNMTLELGTVTDTVSVVAQPSQLETETSSVDQLVQSSSIRDLPLADRRTMNVVQMMGAAVFTGYDSGAKPNFILAGGRAQSQMLWIDGGSGQNMRLGIGQVDTDPPVELVDEIKILSNNYSAEYGASAGGVIIETTKSGTNQARGSAYEHLRNDALDAAGFFAPVQNGATVKPPLRYNVYGGAVGGPVRMNRTFFFFDYEGQRRRTGATQTLTVPTDLQRAGNFSRTFDAGGHVIPIYDPSTTTTGSDGRTVRTQFAGNIIPANRLDPVAVKLMSFYPEPNRAPDSIAGGNNFRANYVVGIVHDFYAGKIDHTLSHKDRLSGRYMYNRDNGSNTSVFPDPGADPINFADAHQQSVYVAWTRILSSSTVNDLRFNYGTRTFHNLTFGIGGAYPQKLELTGVSDNAFPQFSPAGFSAIGSSQQERRQYPIQQQQVVENLSTVHANHALKFGFEARRSRNHEINLPTASGAFGFSTLPTGLPGNAATGNGLASLLLGFPTSFTEQQTDELDRSSWYLAAFAQDDWHASRSLTLNIGLRWETDTPMVDARNRMNSFDPQQINPVSGTPGVVKFLGVDGFRSTPYDVSLNNFGPRFGFAWKVLGSERTVVRGGYGIFFAHPFDAGVPNAVALGFSQSASLNSPDNGITAPFFLRNGVPDVAASSPARNDSFGAVPVGKPATTAVTFFETNRRTGYSRQFNLGIQRQLPGSAALEITGLGNLSRNLPGSNLSINQISPDILGPAHQSQKDRPFPQFSNVAIQSPTLGVSNYYAGMLRVEKRFSHGLNLLSTYTYSKFLEDANDIGTTAGQDGGAYSTFYNRRADYGPSANDIRHRFTFSSVYELPFGKGKRWLTGGVASSVLGGWGLGNVTVIQSGPPFTVVAQTNTTNAFSAGNLRPNLLHDPNLDSNQRSVGRWFDTSAFAQPPLFQFGNEGRNILRAPGLMEMDFSVLRSFSVTDRIRLQLRGEFFNALNRTNLGVPGRTFGSPDFGVISTAGQARQIQIGAKLSF